MSFPTPSCTSSAVKCRARFALASDNVITHGFVENVEPLFASCVLSVAPLRWGARVKGKINQSMSLGVPVVATSIGAEGMHLVHEHDILIADEPDDFARAVVRLCRDEGLWGKLSRNGYANIENHFSFAAAKRGLTSLLNDLDVLETREPQPGNPTASSAKRKRRLDRA